MVTTATITTDAMIDFMFSFVKYLHMFLIVWIINDFPCKIYSNPCFGVKDRNTRLIFAIVYSFIISSSFSLSVMSSPQDLQKRVAVADLRASF